MKPNPEQDADMAAFENWYGYYGFQADWSNEHGCYQDKQTQFMFAAWKAAKADSRAMQDAFEQDADRAAGRRAKHKQRMRAIFWFTTGWIASVAAQSLLTIMGV